jgi:hypothetical protein
MKASNITLELGVFALILVALLLRCAFSPESVRRNPAVSLPLAFGGVVLTLGALLSILKCTMSLAAQASGSPADIPEFFLLFHASLIVSIPAFLVGLAAVSSQFLVFPWANKIVGMGAAKMMDRCADTPLEHVQPGQRR